MTDATPLDLARAAMDAAADDDDARLAFYARLVESELFLMLAKEPEGTRIEPRLFPLDDGPYVLVYDREDRLARFADGPTPYAALPGRRIARMLAGEGIGLGVNLGEAPSEILLPADAVAWLADTLAQPPHEALALPRDLAPPVALPQKLLSALDAKLARAGGLAQCAYLAAVSYDDGAQAHLLAFIEPARGAEETLAQAVSEAVTFSGLEAGTLDIAFFPEAHVMTARLARAALRFDLPDAPKAPTPPPPPGSDPDTPPRLR